MNMLEGSIYVTPHEADSVAYCNAVPCNLNSLISPHPFVYYTLSKSG